MQNFPISPWERWASLAIAARGAVNAMPSRAKDPIETENARKAWLAAVQVRNAIQDRIVLDFRKQIQGTGPGPAEADLLLFARAAVAEQRLQCRLAHRKHFARVVRSKKATSSLRSSARQPR